MVTHNFPVEGMLKIQANDIELVSVNSLIPHPKNMNKHSEDQIDRLCKIIDYQGFRNPLIVQKGTNLVVAGHGRIQAAKKLGIEKVPVTYQEFESEDQLYACIVSDNAIASWAELDLSMVNHELENLGPIDIDLLGIKDFVVEPIEKFEPQSDEDEVPELKDDPITKRGDVWLLGDHRVMCGDSTMIDDVEKLMNGEKADITFTSPPYNVGKTPNGNEQKYLNDSDSRGSSEYKEFLNEFTNNCLLVSDYVFSNIQSLSGNKIALIEHMYDMRERFADTMIWDKKTAEPAMARKVLNSRFEYIHIFSNEAKRSIGKRDFRGTLPNIFELNSRQNKDYAKVHKATFPIDLPKHFIENFTETSCMDPFNGTGTTLIACESLGRKYYGMELEPAYLDITILRWQNYTGKKAILESNGKTYEELKNAST